MEHLGLWPARDCPVCGEEFGEHTDECIYPALLKKRMLAAKKALSDYGPETIDDILALVDMRGCDSLQGDVWRLMKLTVENLDSQIGQFEIDLIEMRRRRDWFTKQIAKTEEAWLGERYGL